MASASALPNLYQGVEKGSFGYKMLANMGWKEGEGLGATKQGIKEHVKVKKKQDASGVGAAEHVQKLRDWTTGMVGFDAILTGLKEVTRQDHSSSSGQGHSSGYDSESDTSAEVVQAKQERKDAAKGKGYKTVAGKKRRKSPDPEIDNEQKASKKGKKQKQSAPVKSGKKGEHSMAPDSTARPSNPNSDSNTDGEAGIAAAAAAAAGSSKVSRVRAATHLGRYQKREVAKTVRNYSATDLAAILGLPDSAPIAPNAEGAAGWAALTGISNPACAAAAAANSSSSSDGDSSSSDSDDNEDSSEQRLRPGTPPGSETPPGRVLLSGQQAGDTAAAGEEEDADADADAGGGSVWWRSVFVRGGRSGGSVGPSGKTRINISGFQEDDQANLYMQAHDAAVKNKQGLGRAGMPKKVAGARWQGKKTKLGSDDEDDEQQEQEVHQQAEQHPPAGVADGREVFTRNGITIVMPSKVQQQQPSHEQQQQQEGVEQQQGRGQRSGRQKRRRSAADDAEETVVRSTTPAGEALATPVCGSKENKQSRQQQMRSSAQEPVPSSAQKVKWAKLAAKILEGAPKKRMRVQKLHRKVLAVAGFDVEAPGVDTEALYQKMLKKLRKSEGLQVCEKYVAMA